MNLRQVSLIARMSIAMLTVSLVGLLAASIIGWNAGRSTLDANIRDQVVATRTDRAHQIEDYVDALTSMLVSQSLSPATAAAIREFSNGYRLIENGSVDDAVPAAASTSDQITSVGRDSPAEGSNGTLLTTTSLTQYYRDLFLPRLASRAGTRTVLEDVLPTEPATRHLQTLYISDNPSPIGEKDALVDALDGSTYSAHHAQRHADLRRVLKEFELLNLFLIEPDDLRIVYSVFKEADFATSLRRGPFAGSQLGVLARQIAADPVAGEATVVDFSAYRPSFGAAAGFMGAPVLDGTELVGVVAVQLPLDAIDRIMTVGGRWSDVGQGRTGEAYLVGSDRRMRSNSRYAIEELDRWDDIDGLEAERIRRHGSTVLLQQVSSTAALEAFRPERGVAITENYLGDEVISAYSPLDVAGLDWAIIAEVHTDEAFAASSEYRRLVIITAVALAAIVTFVAVAVAERLVHPLLVLRRRCRDAGSSEGPVESERPVEYGTVGRAVETLLGELDRLDQRREQAARARDRSYDALLPPTLARRARHDGTDSVDSFSAVGVISIDTADVEPHVWHDTLPAIEHAALANDVEIISVDGRRLLAACGLRQGHLDVLDRCCRFAARAIDLLGPSSSAGVAVGSTAIGFVGEGFARGDLWGHASAEATRRMDEAEAGRIRVAADAPERLGRYTVSNLPDGILDFESPPTDSGTRDEDASDQLVDARP